MAFRAAQTARHLIVNAPDVGEAHGFGDDDFGLGADSQHLTEGMDFIPR